MWLGSSVETTPGRGPLTTGSEPIFQTRADVSEDDSFQKLLLTFTSAAAQALSSAEILKTFCRAAGGYFQVSGTYVWHLLPPDQMIGAAADGWMADRFQNTRLSADESAIASQAILSKKAVYFNAINPAHDAMAAEYDAKSMMAVPLLLSNEVIGAAVFLHTTEPHFFRPDDLAKASILAAQLGSFLEALRLSELAREEQRRAAILAEVAHSLGSEPDLPAMTEAVADRLRALLRTPLVCILIRGATGYSLWAVAAETAAAAASVRARFDRENEKKDPEDKDTDFASDLANRAVLAGEPISVAIDPASHSLSDLVPPGTLLAAPFRTTSQQGAFLVYPRPDGPFSAEEKSLLPVITSFAAIAISNAELIQANAGQASVSLENARFFARMEQANRHWIEIFDAISDFIVAHDESGNVLRVNRSLADFIGVQPQELIGLNMGALLATGVQSASVRCPFCRSTRELHRRVPAPGAGTHLSGFDISGPRRQQRGTADHPRAEGHHGPARGRAPLSRTVRQHPGRSFLLQPRRPLYRGQRRAGAHARPRQPRRTAALRSARGDLSRPAAPSRELFALLERQGTLRNREEVLRQKDGDAVHVLINAFAVRDAQGNVRSVPRSDARRQRPEGLSIRTAAGARFLRQDPQQHPEPDSRRRYRRADQLCQPPLAGPGLRTAGHPRTAAWRIWLPRQKRAALQDAFSAVLAGRQVDNLELQVLRADGRVGQFSVNLSPMRDEQAQVSSIVVVMSDVTDAASLQAKLMHAEKMAAVGQLVSGVAHEVNNPLTAILGFADLLMENQELPESARKDLRVILQEAQRTKQIVQNLLELRAPDAAAAQAGAAQRDSEAHHSAARLRLPQPRRRRHREHIDDDLPFVIGDSQQLQQVFLNILNNAYDAVRESAHRPAH